MTGPADPGRPRAPHPGLDFGRALELCDAAMLALAEERIEDARRAVTSLAMMLVKAQPRPRPPRAPLWERIAAFQARILHERDGVKLDAALHAMTEDMPDEAERKRAEERIARASRKLDPALIRKLSRK